MAYGRDRWKPKMQAFNADVQDRILALVQAILEQNAISVEVRPESRLVDVGLTSMDMVNLMLSVEAEFDFTIPQAEITPENFQSVKTLELMIVGQLQPGTAADREASGEQRGEGSLGRTGGQGLFKAGLL
jgi:acyl carrier protein